MKSFNKLTIDYLDEAKEKLGIKSDNAMAKELSITRSSISFYRTGKSTMDDYTCILVASILEIDPLELIAVANWERENNEEKKAFFANFLKRYGHEMKSLAPWALSIGLGCCGWWAAAGGNAASRIIGLMSNCGRRTNRTAMI